MLDRAIEQLAAGKGQHDLIEVEDE